MRDNVWQIDFHHPHPKGGGCVLVLGTFDGVHRGHQALLQAGRALADDHCCPLVVVTFHPHPLDVLFPEKAPPLLTTLQERAAYLAQHGADRLLVMPFTRAVAAETPADFLHRLEQYHPKAVVAGYNYTFGSRAAGNEATLWAWGAEKDIHIAIVPKVTLEGAGVSSTRIRQLIGQGQMEAAARLLGHHYTLTGRVEGGKQLGRTMGFPTANLAVDDRRVLPAFGVYVCVMATRDGDYPAVVNVGRHPTLPEGAVTVEAHLLGVQLDLYGQQVTLTFLHHLRPEQKFPSREALQAQIGQDVVAATACFRQHGMFRSLLAAHGSTPLPNAKKCS